MPRPQLSPAPRATLPASTTDSALGAPRRPPAGLRARMPADGGVHAVVIVPYSRLGHGVPHGRPRLGRCAGSPRASGPLPGSQTPGLVLLGRSLSPPAGHCEGSARPNQPHPPNSTFPGKGDPKLRDWRCGTFQTLAVTDLGHREGPAACWEL